MGAVGGDHKKRGGALHPTSNLISFQKHFDLPDRCKRHNQPSILLKRLVYSYRIPVFQRELSDQNEYICVLPQV